MIDAVKKAGWTRIIFFAVLFTLAASAVYAAVQLVRAPAGLVEGVDYEKVKSDYVLMLLQCGAGTIVMFLPSMVERKLRIEIPGPMYLVFVLFLYAAVYLGEVRSFYYRFESWDSILHTFSGITLGALGFSIVNILNESAGSKVRLSPFFVALFAFCFAATLGVLWEIYEFTADAFLKVNMQKIMLEDGTMLVGREALRDTMTDLIVDCLGALGTSVAGYVSLRTKTGWLESVSLKRKDRR